MLNTLLIGAHTSAAGGSFNALLEGAQIEATTIQFFTSNQKQWQGREIPQEEVMTFKNLKEKTGIHTTMSHDSYLINLGSPDPLLLTKSRNAFRAEILRCHQLEVDYLNFHPGAYTTSSDELCLDTIIESLLQLEALIHQGQTRLLLETTAGQGTSVGHRFEQLGYIVSRIKDKIDIGVCIDTCHIFSAGYDITSSKGWNTTLEAFDQAIGLQYLSAFHLNDSKNPMGSRKDRHANLGEGFIGLESFRFLMTDPRVQKHPKYLETPDGVIKWKEEIALLRQFAVQ